MGVGENQWLEHLKGVIPPEGYPNRLSAYLVALEGWRRGLKLGFFREKHKENQLIIKYKLKSSEREVVFRSSMGDQVPEEAIAICKDKQLTKQYISRLGVSVPEGKEFTEGCCNNKIIEYGEELGYPLVLKPVDGSGGHGVFSDIKNRDSLVEAISHVREDLGISKVIVEKFIEGNEYRIIVLNGKVVGAINRVPANVTGDGKSTIRELIREKNKKRKQNPHLKGRVIRINEEVINLLYENNYTLDTIPRPDELVLLRLNSNISTGGDSIDVTDKIFPTIEKYALKATDAIPGLIMAGIDMIVDEEKQTGVVIEVNTRPGLGGHIFPKRGTPRDLPKLIIDYYFPETKGAKISNLYFNLTDILTPLRNRSVDFIQVTELPKKHIHGKRILMSGEIDLDRYRIWIYRRAIRLHMHGYTRKLEENKLEIVVISHKKTCVAEFINELKQGAHKSIKNVEDIEVQNWNKPICIGFENKRNHLSRSEVIQLEKENQRIERENEQLLKRYSQIKSSRAWKITSPIRWFIHKLKLAIRSIK